MVVAAIASLVALAVGIVCLIGYRHTRHKLRLITLVPTCTVAELADRLPGEPVELKGLVRCATPLTSEIAGQPCVYYRSVTTREYETTGQDEEGRITRHRGSETVAENEQRVAFQLEDATGQVTVDPFEAEIDARKVVDRFEPYAGAPSGSVTIGGVTIQLSGDSRTLGYRTVEHAVLVGQPVYVLGVLHDDGTVGRPPPGSRFRRFLISARSEEELSKELRQRSYALLAGAVLGFSVATGALVVAVAIELLTSLH